MAPSAAGTYKRALVEARRQAQLCHRRGGPISLPDVPGCAPHGAAGGGQRLYRAGALPGALEVRVPGPRALCWVQGGV